MIYSIVNQKIVVCQASCVNNKRPTEQTLVLSVIHVHVNCVHVTGAIIVLKLFSGKNKNGINFECINDDITTRSQIHSSKLSTICILYIISFPLFYT